MSLFVLVAFFLASWSGRTAAMALSGWQEPDHNVTRVVRNKRANMQIAVIATKLETIYLSGDPRRMRTAGFGFDYQIDGGLWALCATTIANPKDCMVARCFDSSLCSTGCGYLDRTTMNAITCSKGSNQFCATAILTHQKAVQPVTNYACSDDIQEDHYMGFTTDSLPEDFVTSTTTTTSALETSTGPGASIPQIATESSGPSSSETPPSSSTLGPAADSSTQSSSGGATNTIGAIVGGAIGGMAVLCGFSLTMVLLLRRNRNTTAKSPSASLSTIHEGDGMSSYGKPELEASERAEMSARGPAAYDTADYRPRYPPMTPVELPVTFSPR